MFNKQLRKNIKALDAHIGELSIELAGLKKDTKYDQKARLLGDLVDFRCKLVKNKDDEKSLAVIELDKQIEELTKMISHLASDEVYTAKMSKLEELTKIRAMLSEAKVNESNMPAVIGLVGSLSAILLVLKHEEANVITSKAFSIATKMFRG